MPHFVSLPSVYARHISHVRETFNNALLVHMYLNVNQKRVDHNNYQQIVKLFYNKRVITMTKDLILLKILPAGLNKYFNPRNSKYSNANTEY